MDATGVPSPPDFVRHRNTLKMCQPRTNDDKCIYEYVVVVVVVVVIFVMRYTKGGVRREKDQKKIDV
jgi:hypothetical protein